MTEGQPTCPMDGVPLAGVTSALNEPTIYEHCDGSSHYDSSADLTAARMAPSLDALIREMHQLGGALETASRALASSAAHLHLPAPDLVVKPPRRLG